MGGLGSHHGHSYIVQTVAFVISLLLPGSALALVAGAYFERLRRRQHVHPAPEQVSRRLPLVAGPTAD